MRYASLMLFASALLAVGAHGVSVAGDEMVTHHGTILAIDASRGQLIFEETRPPTSRDAVADSIRITVELIPATRYTFASGTDTPCDPVHGSVESPLDPVFLEVGDTVSIECRHEGGRLIAVKVTVTAMR
jgi:hypothetical protein